MRRHLRRLLAEPDYAEALAEHGRRTILRRHTCGHRAEQLLAICRELGLVTGPEEGVPCAAG
jgi:spore maturation protein CgeB